VQFSSTDVKRTCAKNTKETLFVNRGVIISALEGVAGDHDRKSEKKLSELGPFPGGKAATPI
jgi:hypothetical protein